ncbi:MAG: hypothetical protein AAF205_05470 [Pseudomonadota bacterium]
MLASFALTPLSAQARAATGSAGVKIVAGATIGFDPRRRGFAIGKRGGWIAPTTSRARICLPARLKARFRKGRCVTIRTVEFE